MTIASCYLSPEGVVLGADSTTTYISGETPHYFNNAQKVFEIGEDASLGLITWGLGGFSQVSFRQLIAELSDQLEAVQPSTVFEVANQWIDLVWAQYTSSFGNEINECQRLAAKEPFQSGQQVSNARTQDEENIFRTLRNQLVMGFCIGGHILPKRASEAYAIILDPMSGKPSPSALGMGEWSFWGAPNLIQRLINGCDDNLKSAILNSGHWNGNENDLQMVLNDQVLAHPTTLPIRDAIDFVHSCISSTIKSMKFSYLSQICGGPIEIAVITSDRRFRWVRHKNFDAAIKEGNTHD
ncbi:hypothetical protein [Pyruvatibacter mobilis]|uniref:hypothetical protein n=1 Tax=Pyruvatibacter mobilis TaxID=1712261 RepID=UPI003BA8CBD1